jgi:hypothetical protein
MRISVKLEKEYHQLLVSIGVFLLTQVTTLNKNGQLL